jgi:Mrp family chromosome partitioning ATPase
MSNLHLVATGMAPSGTLGTLEAPAFARLLAHYKAAYDLILCTAPSAPHYTDAALLGSTADATCLVLQWGLSRLDTSLEAKDTLEAVQAHVAGAILINF